MYRSEIVLLYLKQRPGGRWGQSLISGNLYYRK